MLAAPAVGADVVVVHTVDGRLLGLDAATGKERWREEQQVPRLTLRGAGSPVIAGNLAVCGFDNGRVLAVNVEDGQVAPRMDLPGSAASSPSWDWSWRVSWWMTGWTSLMISK